MDLPHSAHLYVQVAEVYLNRAEAYAKKGDVASAVADLNEILVNRLIVPEGEVIDDYLSQ